MKTITLELFKHFNFKNCQPTHECIVTQKYCTAGITSDITNNEYCGGGDRRKRKNYNTFEAFIQHVPLKEIIFMKLNPTKLHVQRGSRTMFTTFAIGHILSILIIQSWKDYVYYLRNDLKMHGSCKDKGNPYYQCTMRYMDMISWLPKLEYQSLKNEIMKKPSKLR